MATMLSRRISLLGNELSQQCHIAMHMDKDRQRMQPNSGSSSTVEENGCTLELPGVCGGGGGRWERCEEMSVRELCSCMWLQCSMCLLSSLYNNDHFNDIHL